MKRGFLLVAVVLFALGGADRKCSQAKGVSLPRRDGVFVVQDEGQIFLQVTGKGASPRRTRRRAQARLLARRAATLEAYKKLTETIGNISSYLVVSETESFLHGHKIVARSAYFTGESGYIQTEGFIKGARRADVRDFPGGKCEVTLILPVRLKKNAEQRLHRAGYTILKDGAPVEYQAKEISKEEWMKLYFSPRT